MSTANWVSQPDLNSYSETYNFNLHPVTLTFSADPGAVVTAINGSWPQGITAAQIDNTLVLAGVSTGVAVSLTSNITYRITDPDGTIADRTFYITITPESATVNWAGQNTDLGYAVIGRTAQFTVTAAIGIHTSIQYRIISPPSGMSINSATGVITYTAAQSVIPTDATRPFMGIVNIEIRASAANSTSTETFAITVIETGHAPAWITPSGRLGEYVMGKYVEVAVSAFDPADHIVSYALVSHTARFPYTLTATGFLYGAAPVYSEPTTVTFTVSATSITGTANRTFTLLIIQDVTSRLLYWRTASGNLGVYSDGQTVAMDVGAVSTTAGPGIQYRLIGGTLPLNLTLNTSQGYIAGFLEYHPQARNYYWEIAADDGSQTIIRQYTVTVVRSQLDQTVTASFPVMSDIRAAVAETRQAMFDRVDLIPYHSVLTDNAATEVSLIAGLDYSHYNMDSIFRSANTALHSTTVTFGNTSNVAVAGTNQFYYRNIVDPQSGNNYSTSSIDAISLAGMRTALARSTGFANTGRGSGAKLLPIIDYTVGSISTVQLVDGGVGYITAPLLTVTGTGQGAVLSCTIAVRSVTVVSPGYAWTVNESAFIRVNGTAGVTVEVTAVDSIGSIVSIRVAHSSSFTVFPVDKKTVFNSQGIAAELKFNLGIDTVTIEHAGTGYDEFGTAINAQGSELLAPWQTQWIPYVPLDTVVAAGTVFVDSNLTNDTLQILGSKSWKIQHLLLTAQGKTWAGNSMFDQDLCSFDGDTTRFVEWIEPCNTVFDLDNTQFDVDGTRFDENRQFVHTAQRMWGDTVFDSEITVFDLYNTIFDSTGPSSHSITEIRKLYRLTSQQISGNNTVA